MSILVNEILYYLTGGAANTDPNASLGGITSTTLVGSANPNLFASIFPAEAAAGSVVYRAVDVKNTTASGLTLTSAQVWILTETTSTDTTVAIAYDSVGTQSVVNETTAPSGLSFSTPLTQGTAISLGDMAPNVTKRIWLRRTTNAGAVKTTLDTGSIFVQGGTT